MFGARRLLRFYPSLFHLWPSGNLCQKEADLRNLEAGLSWPRKFQSGALPFDFKQGDWTGSGSTSSVTRMGRRSPDSALMQTAINSASHWIHCPSSLEGQRAEVSNLPTPSLKPPSALELWWRVRGST